MATERQTTEQARAAKAWEFVDGNVPESQQKKYGTLARKLPAMIQTNGLGTAMAFLLAKAGRDRQDGHYLIYGHISQWVTDRIGYKKELMDLIRNEPMNVYRRATTEAIEFGIWLKRYVEAKDWGSAGGED